MSMVVGKFLKANLDDLADVDIDGTLEEDNIIVWEPGLWVKGDFLNVLTRDFIPSSKEWEIKEHRQLHVSDTLTLEGTLHLSGGIVRLD